MDAESPFGFLSAANEAFGYSHRETLAAPYALMLALMRERGYTVNKRNREMERGDDSKGDDGEEYRMIRDFETGEMRPVRVAKGGRI